MAYNLSDIIGKFRLDGDIIHAEPYGHGRINDTYAAYFKFSFARPVRYILQRINQDVFPDPAALMRNIRSVTDHITEKIEYPGGDSARETLHIVPTREGDDFYLDPEGNYWRVYHFIDDAATYQHGTGELLRQSGAAFGHFQNLLADFPVHTLNETIPDFHNTKQQFEALEEAVRMDVLGRVSQAEPEIEFAFSRGKDAPVLTGLIETRELPLRAIHCDAQLNNVMIDNTSGKALGVIDLDTVMPGLSLYDFGDSIRLGAVAAGDNGSGPSGVSLNLDLFRAFTAGFLFQMRGTLTQTELELLPFGVRMMVFESGIRSLADYLNGDTRFKTKRRGQTLDICRTRFRLVEDLESKMDRMAEIVAKENISCTCGGRVAESLK